jgi:hypothetical protein
MTNIIKFPSKDDIHTILTKPEKPLLKTTEDGELRKFFDYVRIKANQDSRYNNILHVPNEGKRSWSYGKKMKAMGLAAGFPDIAVLVPTDTHHGLFMEMKIFPNKTTANQDKWLTQLLESGYCVAVVWSGDEAITILSWYMAYALPKTTS